MSGCVPEEGLPTTPGRAASRRRLTDGLRGDPQRKGEWSAAAARAIGPPEGMAGGEEVQAERSIKPSALSLLIHKDTAASLRRLHRGFSSMPAYP